MDNLSDQILWLLDQAIDQPTEKAIEAFVSELIRVNYTEYEIIAYYNLPETEDRKEQARDVVRGMAQEILDGGLGLLIALRMESPYTARMLRGWVKRIALGFGDRQNPDYGIAATG